MIRAAKRGNVITHSLHADADPAFDMSPLIDLAKTKRQSRIFGGLTRQYFNLLPQELRRRRGHPQHLRSQPRFPPQRGHGGIRRDPAHRRRGVSFWLTVLQAVPLFIYKKMMG